MDLFSYLLGKKSAGGAGGADLSDYFTPTIGTGTSDSSGFAKMIKKIPDTTTVEGTSLSYGFYKYLGTTIPLIDTSNVTDMSSMFSGCSNLISIPLLNTSNVTDMSSMFIGCSSLISIPLLNTSNVTKVVGMFSGCSNLISIPLLNTSNVVTNQAISMFSGCSSLTTVPLLNTSKISNMSNMFNGCSSLTDTSLDNILQMCINSNVSTQSRKNLAFIGLTSDNYPASRIEALPHYQDFIDAGWTIGY